MLHWQTNGTVLLNIHLTVETAIVSCRKWEVIELFQQIVQSLVFVLTVTEEDEVVKKSKKVYRSQTVASQNPETELMLEGDDDAVSLLQEKEMDNLGGKSAHRHLH